IYGVVAGDAAATEAARAEIRARRLGEGRLDEGSGGTLDDAEVLHPVSDTVEAVEHGGERSLRCTVCHYRFGSYGEDHKRAAVVHEVPLRDASPVNGRCGEEFVLREFCCPGCATLVAVDVQKQDDPIVDESALST